MKLSQVARDLLIGATLTTGLTPAYSQVFHQEKKEFYAKASILANIDGKSHDEFVRYHLVAHARTPGKKSNEGFWHQIDVYSVQPQHDKNCAEEISATQTDGKQYIFHFRKAGGFQWHDAQAYSNIARGDSQLIRPNSDELFFVRQDNTGIIMGYNSNTRTYDMQNITVTDTNTLVNGKSGIRFVLDDIAKDKPKAAVR